jgi:hypothetical protein
MELKLIICALHHKLLGFDGWGMYHERGRGKMLTEILTENLNGRDHFEKIKVKMGG